MTRLLQARAAASVLLAAIIVVALAACEQPGPSLSSGATAGVDAASSTVSSAPPFEVLTGEVLTGELVVLAAASLTEAFTELGTALEARHPELTVTFSFGGSAALAEQIVSGAPADVFASASTSTMQRAVTGLLEAGATGAEALSPAHFATNSMILAVPLANDTGVTGLADLARDDVTFALCEAQVPCGAATERVLEAAGITALPVTYEKDVTAVLTKVRSDEVDAGIVYVTDIDHTVTGIELPADVSTTTSYPILALPEAPNPDAAAAFTAFVLSDEGLAVLASHGFAAP